MSSRTSSVPALPRLQEETSGELTKSSPSLHGNLRSPSGAVGSTSPWKLRSKALIGPEAGRDRQIMRAFNRAILGKSLLVLTDKGDTQKAVTKALMSARHNTDSEVDLVFVKTKAELVSRLGDMKENYHALLLDLSKKELQVENLLPVLRDHQRYNRLPIIVLSGQTELSDVVRNSCSFVVFFPLAAVMLREALLWCFDRKALLMHSDYPVAQTQEEPRNPAAKIASPVGERTSTPIHDPSMCIIASSQELRSHARRELRPH